MLLSIWSKRHKLSISQSFIFLLKLKFQRCNVQKSAIVPSWYVDRLYKTRNQPFSGVWPSHVSSKSLIFHPLSRVNPIFVLFLIVPWMCFYSGAMRHCILFGAPWLSKETFSSKILVHSALSYMLNLRCHFIMNLKVFISIFLVFILCGCWSYCEDASGIACGGLSCWFLGFKLDISRDNRVIFVKVNKVIGWCYSKFKSKISWWENSRLKRCINLLFARKINFNLAASLFFT